MRCSEAEVVLTLMGPSSGREGRYAAAGLLSSIGANNIFAADDLRGSDDDCDGDDAADDSRVFSSTFGNNILAADDLR